MTKENKVGKPIQKKHFGLPVTSGSNHIKVDKDKFADGTVVSNAYIVKQTGSTAYMVQDALLARSPEIVFMVNATNPGALLPGQCFITTTPFGGSAIPCAKITQYRVKTYEADGSIGNYSWSLSAADHAGQSTLVQ